MNDKKVREMLEKVAVSQIELQCSDSVCGGCNAKCDAKYIELDQALSVIEGQIKEAESKQRLKALVNHWDNKPKIDEEKLEELISLKLAQMLVEDKPDQRGYTKARVLTEAIALKKDVWLK